MTNIGEKVEAKARKITPNGVVVVFTDENSELKNKTAFLHISKIKSKFIKNIEDEVQLGERLIVEIIKKEGDKNYVRLIEKKQRKRKKEKEKEEIKKPPFEAKLTSFFEESKQRQKEIKQGMERRRNKRLYLKNKRKK